tara:strand:+ start:104 stop:673 length:570 start_codon:yes stop_codon:yes gene_type:complete
MDIQEEPVVKTYRFKISNDKLYEEMVLFADINRFLNRKDLKEAYEKWTEEPEISLMISAEEEMLTLNNYNLGKNNISQKIFKSIKYYHIKKIISKSPNVEQSSSKKEKKKSEIVFSKEFLENVKQVLQNNKELKPSQYYDKFVNEFEETVKREKGRLGCINEEKVAVFDKKLKKMMKNQYYMMFQKYTC